LGDTAGMEYHRRNREKIYFNYSWPKIGASKRHG
jgi:hypothetical protein